LKKSVIALMSYATLIPIAIPMNVFAGTPMDSLSIDAKSSTSNIVVVDRSPVAGVNQAINATKTSKGQSDPTALNALVNSQHFTQLQNDLDSGKILLFMGNSDGKLSSQLLHDAFHKAGPVQSTANFKDNTSYHVIAEAVYKIPHTNQTTTFGVYSNGSVPLTADAIRTDLQNEYNHVSQMALQHTATTTTSGTVQPNSTPTGSDPNWTYTSSELYCYELEENGSYASGNIIGKFLWGYDVTRHLYGSSVVWDMRRRDQITPGFNMPSTYNGQPVDTSGVNCAIWQSIGVEAPGTTQPISGEKLLSFGPALVNAGQTSVSFTLTGDIPSVTYTYSSAGQSTANRSSANLYGAWSSSFNSSSDYYDPCYQSMTLDPGVRAENDYGDFMFNGDFKISFMEDYNSQIISDTGDVSDSVTMNVE
jgi:hypothetical protein